MPKIFIAGIDTDVGKTYITGLLAKYLALNNKSVITHKFHKQVVKIFQKILLLIEKLCLFH